MATVANFGAGFDGAAFKAAIRATMKMASPTQVPMKATFRWKTEKTHTLAGPGGRPYNFASTPTAVVAHSDVVLDEVAVQFVTRLTQGGGTAVGHFDTPRAILTMFTEEYDQVNGCDFVLLGGSTYRVDFWAPPVALFEVDVFTLHISAVDET